MASKRRKLTKRVVDAATYEGREYRDANGRLVQTRDVLWDTEIPGFGLRLYPSGRKAFILSYRFEGRKRLVQLGDYGQNLTVELARKKARKDYLKIADDEQDYDPLRERQREAKAETVIEFCDLYVARHASRKKTRHDDERRIEKHLKPAWGSRKVKSIKRGDVATLHHKIGETAPYEANRLLALIRKMWNLAVDWGVLDETAPNPAQRIKPFKEKARDRWVTPQELPELAKAIDQEPNVYARAGIWLYLLTGMRRSELLTLKWTDVDLERREIRLGDTKQDKPHYVPLAPPVVEILESVPRQDGNPHVLCGQKQGHHLVNIDKAWRRVRRAAGVEDVRLHDLRRTVGSWLAQNGADLHLIGRVLGHSQVSTTAVYARFAQDHVRKALEDHAERVLQVAGRLKAPE